MLGREGGHFGCPPGAGEESSVTSGRAAARTTAADGAASLITLRQRETEDLAPHGQDERQQPQPQRHGKRRCRPLAAEGSGGRPLAPAQGEGGGLRGNTIAGRETAADGRGSPAGRDSDGREGRAGGSTRLAVAGGWPRLDAACQPVGAVQPGLDAPAAPVRAGGLCVRVLGSVGSGCLRAADFRGPQRPRWPQPRAPQGRGRTMRRRGRGDKSEAHVTREPRPRSGMDAAGGLPHDAARKT